MTDGLFEELDAGRAGGDVGRGPQCLSDGRGAPNWRARCTASSAVATARSGASCFSARARWSCQGTRRVAHAARVQAASGRFELGGGFLGEAAGEQQFAVHGLDVGEGDGGREGRAERVVLADLGGLGDATAGEQDLDDDADGVPVDGVRAPTRSASLRPARAKSSASASRPRR